MRIGLIGAGNMARAIVRGWGEPVLCCDAGSGRARELAAELGGEALAGPAEVAAASDALLLAHKPAGLASVAAAIEAAGKPVLSVLGGVTLAQLEAAYPGSPVVRLMPNTPVEVRRGITCVSFGPGADEALRAEVTARFSRLGTVEELPEHQIEAASAVMGVGPAYEALLAEAQVDAAVRHGLPPALAGRLVAETKGGTAALLAARGYDSLAVRREVTSPGGSTARGLAALERGGVRAAFGAAIDAVLGWEPRR
jgi:pyrroline-5-carboxylate reductase